MVNFLLPITFFSKNYTNSLAETTSMVAFPVFILIILLQLYRFPNRLSMIRPKKSAVYMGIFVWVVQLFDMLRSYGQTGETQLTSGLLHTLIVFAGWTATVYVAWAVIQVTVVSERDEKVFIKAGLLALVFYLLLVVLPQVTVTVGLHRFEHYVDLIAKVFERHWRMHGKGYDFYASGSYVTTENRVNGFEPEAAFLANLLGVTYLPILIGLTTTKQKFWNWTKTRLGSVSVNIIFAFVLFVILLLAKTTTGILTAVIAYLLWIVWAKGGQRYFLVAMAFTGVAVLALAYLKVPTIHNLLNQFLFAKGGTDNRLGGTIGLLLTFVTHPLVGVGYGFTSYYIIQNVPEATTHNFEFQQVYSQYGYPNLSDFLGWFAAFGLIIMVPAFFLLFRLVTRTYFVKYRLAYLALSDEEKSWSRALIIAFLTMIVLAAFSSIFVIQVFLWPYLLMFFFYRKHILRLEQEIQK